jgi:hypothetical protein
MSLKSVVIFSVVLMSAIYTLAAIPSMKDLVAKSKFNEVVQFRAEVKKQLSDREFLVSDGSDTYIVELNAMNPEVRVGENLDFIGEWALRSTPEAKQLGATAKVKVQSVKK